MFVKTFQEVGVAYFGMNKGTVTRTIDVYKCDHCPAVYPCLRILSEGKPTEPFYCRECNQPISVKEKGDTR